MNIRAVLQLIREPLQQAGYPFAVVGAVALNAYGLGRGTGDIDLLVPRAAQSMLLGLMSGAGYEPLAVSEGFSNHLHPIPSLGRVDFLYVDETTAATLFAEARRVPLSGVGEVMIPRAEHLVAMKAQAIKSNPERKLKDLADVRFLLRLADIDLGLCRRYFEQAGLLEEWRVVTEGLS